MPTTIDKTPKNFTEKVKKETESAIVPDISVIIKKTYRMAETLKNARLPGE